VDDTADELAALGGARHERGFGDDHRLYRNEFRINDVVAEVVRGMELLGDLGIGFEIREEPVNSATDRISFTVRVERDSTVRLTLKMFEGPVFDGVLANLDALGTLLRYAAGDFLKPSLAGKTVAALSASPDSTLFGVEFFAMGTPERSPFLGLKVMDSVIRAYW